MNASQHLASTVLGFVTANGVVQSTNTLPATKGEIIALVSAVVVQSIIYGVSKLFSWLRKKNEKPVETPTPTPTV